jgi:hypothetical protein
MIYCNGLPAQWKKYEDFSGWYIVMGYLPRWSHCNGLPAQWKKYEDFLG